MKIISSWSPRNAWKRSILDILVSLHVTAHDANILTTGAYTSFLIHACLSFGEVRVQSQLLDLCYRQLPGIFCLPPSILS